MSNNNQKEKRIIKTINPETKTSMISRLLMSAILIAIVLPTLFIGNYVYFTLVFVIALISCHELIKAPQSISRKYKNCVYIFAYFMMIAIIYWIFIRNNLSYYKKLSSVNESHKFIFSLTSGFNLPQISLTAFCISIGFFFFMVFIDNNFTIKDAYYFICMLFVVSMGLQCFYFLRYFPLSEAINNEVSITPHLKYFKSALLVIYVLFGVCFNDAGAYFTGLLLGKHKMIPNISPKKTWEGFFGGILISFLISFTFAFILAIYDTPLINCLDKKHWYNILILSLIMPFTAVLGDLMFSSIKREFNIKDFGTILKSHGGILDRIDSLIFTSISVSLLIVLMSQNWEILL